MENQEFRDTPEWGEPWYIPENFQMEVMYPNGERALCIVCRELAVGFRGTNLNVGGAVKSEFEPACRNHMNTLKGFHANNHTTKKEATEF